MSEFKRYRLDYGWVACEEPERPPDAFVRWHYNACRGCLIKAQAQQQRFPDDIHVRHLVEMLESAWTEEP